MSEKKQNNSVQGLNDYFNNTPQEQLEKEFNELEKWNRIGPNVLNYLDYFKGFMQQKVIDKMHEEVPVLESISSLSEADVRHVIELFQESSKYFNKKIEDERDANGGSQLAIDLLDGIIDAKELAVQYVLHKLNINSD